MKKYLRIGLMMILIILLVLAFLFWKRWMENKLKDDEIEIVQEIASGIPFQWTYTISNDKLLLIKQYNQSKHPGKQLNGGRIEKHYIFKAQSPRRKRNYFRFGIACQGGREKYPCLSDGNGRESPSSNCKKERVKIGLSVQESVQK